MMQSVIKGGVEVLIAHGADVNKKIRAGYTPLHVALKRAQQRNSELLMQHGADVNIKDQNGLSLVENALQNNNIEMAALLMARGAKVNTDSYVWTHRG